MEGENIAIEDKGISMDLFREIFNSLKEVQKGSFRLIGDQLVNSLPLDLDIQLSDCLSKMERLMKQRDEASIKIVQSYGCIIEPIPTGVNISAPEDKKDDPDFIPKVLAEVNIPIDFDVHSELPLFTKERWTKSNIELQNAPNRQTFYQEILK